MRGSSVVINVNYGFAIFYLGISGLMSVVFGGSNSTRLGRLKMGIERLSGLGMGLEGERKVTGRDWKEIEIMVRWLGRKSW